MKVVLATRNKGKLRELIPLLSGPPLLAHLALDLCTIDDVAPDAELREDGVTFVENALAKARQAARASGLPAIADDSGLEVDALDGAPGVYSARYAGPGADDDSNNAKLLEALRGVPPARRTARFRCVAVFVDPARALELVRDGACEGEVLQAPRGQDGFGYDPLFFVPTVGRTMAELPLEEKNRLSHRAAAFRALAEALGSTLARENG